jgi:hypothetical protein
VELFQEIRRENNNASVCPVAHDLRFNLFIGQVVVLDNLARSEYLKIPRSAQRGRNARCFCSKIVSRMIRLLRSAAPRRASKTVGVSTSCPRRRLQPGAHILQDLFGLFFVATLKALPHRNTLAAIPFV